jgi:hypothetical protein
MSIKVTFSSVFCCVCIQFYFGLVPHYVLALHWQFLMLYFSIILLRHSEVDECHALFSNSSIAQLHVCVLSSHLIIAIAP